MMKEDHRAVGELITAIRRMLARFASKVYADERADPETGVLVQYNRRERNKVAFVFTTADKLTVRIVYDLNETSREYLAAMVKGVLEQLRERRRDRAKHIIEIPSNALVRAVQETVH